MKTYYPPDFNSKKFSVLVNYDLTNETDEDIRYDIVEDEISKLRCLIYEKIKQLPRGAQLIEKLDEIYDAVNNCLP